MGRDSEDKFESAGNLCCGAVMLGLFAIGSLVSYYTGSYKMPVIDPEIKDNIQMTLVSKAQDKVVFRYGAIRSSELNFDTDGNTNTTEVVAYNSNECCAGQTAQIYNIPLGKRQSLEEWKKDLFCKKCHRNGNWSVKKLEQAQR